ncbi:MAG: sodium ion-translocating decarboxylase subunit beta, partial [Clostridia bacterium]|nr:sodium ion-translocating decarboxylase subunit beta [Clostridia bacterium]
DYNSHRADKTQSHKNEYSSSYENAMQKFDELLPKKRRKNAVVGLNFIVTTSEEFSSKAEELAFYDQARNYISKNFGRVVGWAIHRDETSTHLLFFDINDAASIAIIGAADGPTSIVVAQKLDSNYLGAIMVAAYSYMALVPIIQPPVIKLLTTKKERLIRMPYEQKDVKKSTRILFPIVITIIAGIVAPASVSLVGFLMFGNLIRECGVLNSLSETAQKVLANLITIFLGITIASQMEAANFLSFNTLLILGLGLVAFIFDTAGGVLFAKLINIFLPKNKKINPMIGAAGISAFPMSGRIVHKMGLAEDPQNFLLMHSIGVNVSGQIASVIAGGLILNFFM